VRRVGERARGQRPAKRDELLQRCEGAGRVLEPGRRTARAVGKRRAHHGDHSIELVPRRRPIRSADDHGANGSQPDHRRHVHRRRELRQIVPELREGLILVSRILAALARRSRRARGSVLTDDDRGDSLSNEGFRAWILPERPVAVRMDVDESRGDGEALGIDLDLSLVRRASHDRDDLPACDDDVALDAGAAHAVEDRAAADDDVRRRS
jgi:hypothetical protein